MKEAFAPAEKRIASETAAYKQPERTIITKMARTFLSVIPRALLQYQL